MVRVDVTNPHSEYAIASGVAAGAATPSGDAAGASSTSSSLSPMSSFRPSDGAKLYALPEDVESVGYSTLQRRHVKSPLVSSPGSSIGPKNRYCSKNRFRTE